MFFYAAASVFIKTEKPAAAICGTNANALSNPSTTAGGWMRWRRYRETVP
jgi:hypothetical protein